MKKILLISLLCFTTIYFSGCIKPSDLEDLELKLNTSLPLGSLYLDDNKLIELISDQELHYTSEGTTSFATTKSITILEIGNIDRIFKMGNQNIAINIPLVAMPAQIIPIPENTFIEYKLALDEDASIENLIFSGGSISLTSTLVNNPYKNLGCRIDEITKDGVPLTLNFGEVKNLAGYTITPTDGNKIKVVLLGNIANSDRILVDVKMESIMVNSASGSFGNKSIASVTQTLDVKESTSDLFKNTKSFKLANPFIEVPISSNINIPALVIVEKIAIDNIILYPKKGLRSDRFIVEQGMTSILINNDNFEDDNSLTNAITKDISTTTVYISAIINPTADQIMDDKVTISTKNSFSADAYMGGTVDLNFPIDGYFEDIVFSDKIALELDQSIRDGEYRSISYAILANNELPFDIELSLFSEKNGVKESLGSIDIPSSENNVNPEKGDVVPGIIDDKNAQIITLDANKTSSFITADNIIFEFDITSMNIEQKQYIKFYKNTFLSLDMILGIDGDINIAESN